MNLIMYVELFLEFVDLCLHTLLGSVDEHGVSFVQSLQRSGRRPTCFLFLDNGHDGPLSDVSRIEKVIMPDVNEVVLPAINFCAEPGSRLIFAGGVLK